LPVVTKPPDVVVVVVFTIGPVVPPVVAGDSDYCIDCFGFGCTNFIY